MRHSHLCASRCSALSGKTGTAPGRSARAGGDCDGAQVDDEACFQEDELLYNNDDTAGRRARIVQRISHDILQSVDARHPNLKRKHSMQITSREMITPSSMWPLLHEMRKSLERASSEAVTGDQREQQSGQGRDEDGEEGDPGRSRCTGKDGTRAFSIESGT